MGRLGQRWGHQAVGRPARPAPRSSWPSSAPRRPTSCATTSCGASTTLPDGAGWPSSTAPGMDGSSSNGSSGWRPRSSGGSRLRRDPPVRVVLGRRGDDRHQDLHPHLPRRAAEALRGPAGRSAQALEAHRRGLAPTAKWAAYEDATEDMLKLTDQHPTAPWDVVSAEQKRHGQRRGTPHGHLAHGRGDASLGDRRAPFAATTTTRASNPTASSRAPLGPRARRRPTSGVIRGIHWRWTSAGHRSAPSPARSETQRCRPGS